MCFSLYLKNITSYFYIGGVIMSEQFKKAQEYYRYDGGRWQSNELDNLSANINNFANPNYEITQLQECINRSLKSIKLEAYKYHLPLDLLKIFSKYEKAVDSKYVVYSDCLSHRESIGLNNIDFEFKVPLPYKVAVPPILINELSFHERNILEKSIEKYPDIDWEKALIKEAK